MKLEKVNFLNTIVTKHNRHKAQSSQRTEINPKIINSSNRPPAYAGYPKHMWTFIKYRALVAWQMLSEMLGPI